MRGTRHVAGNCTTDGTAVPTIIAEAASVEGSAILAQIVDVSKGCKEAVLVGGEEVNIVVTGEISGVYIVGEACVDLC